MVYETLNPDYQLPARMDKKMRAIPFPDLTNMTVLDVGCDMGFWTKFALANGSQYVIGLDRGREVRHHGYVDLVDYCYRTIKDDRASFSTIDIGKQYRSYGTFDVIFMFSVYHHIYQNTGGDHLPIWLWLADQTRKGSIVLWENPVTQWDAVVQKDVNPNYHINYSMLDIINAAERWFEYERIGPSLHESTREVYRFTRKARDPMTEYSGTVEQGAGGAHKAFLYADRRRINEIETVLGFAPVPGSLNLYVNGDLHRAPYFRAEVLDVVDRSKGLDSPWHPRWARFYPTIIEGERAFAFRFEGEKYPKWFVELISSHHLRTLLGIETNDTVKLWT